MDKRLDNEEIKKLLIKLNYDVNPKYLKFLVEKFDKDRSGAIEFKEFIPLMDFLRFRDELTHIY